MNLTTEQATFIVQVLLERPVCPTSHEVAIQRSLLNNYAKAKRDESINETKLRAKAAWLTKHLETLGQAPVEPTLTPLQQRYAEACKANPGSIVLMKMGDFYEVFGDDAATVANVLNIALTKRKGVPMAGIPYHCIDQWTDKLEAAGHRVVLAYCTPFITS